MFIKYSIVQFILVIVILFTLAQLTINLIHIKFILSNYVSNIYIDEEMYTNF